MPPSVTCRRVLRHRLSVGFLPFLLFLQVFLNLHLGSLKGLLQGLVKIVRICNGHDNPVGNACVPRHGPVKVAELNHYVSGTNINIKYIPVNVIEFR